MARCSAPVAKLVDYAHEDVRSSSLTALSQFAICLGGGGDCLEAVDDVLPKLLDAINNDVELEVVVDSLDCLAELLKELKGLVLKNPKHLDSILDALKAIFNKKVHNNFVHFLNSFVNLIL